MKCLLFAVVFLATLATALATTNGSSTPRIKPQKVVIDTDIGRYMDDYFSIAYLVGHHHTQWRLNQTNDQLEPPLIDIRLILTAYDNTTGRAVLTSMFLEKFGDAAHGIDVGAGLRTAESLNNTGGVLGGVGPGKAWVDQNNYTYNDFIDNYPTTHNATVYLDGIRRLEHLLDTEATEEDPIVLVAIAPVINLGDLLGRRPELKRRLAMVVMAGSINVGYRGSSVISAEDNLDTNVSASRIVFGTGSTYGSWTYPIYDAPLDSTEVLQIYGEPYYKFLAAAKLGFAGAKTLMEAYHSWYEEGGTKCYAHIPSGKPCTPEWTTPTLYDMQAAYMAIELIKSNNRLVAQGLPKSFSASGFKDLEMSYISHLQVNTSGFSVPCCPSTVVGPGKCADCADRDRWTGVHSALRWTSGQPPLDFQVHAVKVLTGASPLA